MPGIDDDPISIPVHILEEERQEERQREHDRYIEEFKNGFWIPRGSDPNVQERVRTELQGKINKTRHKGCPPGLLSIVGKLRAGLEKADDLMPKCLVFGALIYFISPIDMCPDFIPAAGLLDDLAILTYVFDMVKDRL